MDNSAEQLSDKGKEAYQNNDYEMAAVFFLEAEKSFQKDGDSLQAAEMANNRSVALLQAGKAKEAYAASQNTHLIFENVGDSLREGFALGNQAAALNELGKKSESLKLYRLSAEKLQQAGDRENLIVVQKTISSLELESGSKINAMSAMLDALRTKEKLTFREKILRKLFSLVSRLMP
jgi:tetratricopeptide (TPR) repeat protein